MEIKCRGYDRDTKRWYYGGYFKHQIKEICPVQFSDETAADKEPKYEHYIKLGELLGAVAYRKESAEFVVILSDETIAHGAAFEYGEIVGNTYENIDLLA